VKRDMAAVARNDVRTRKRGSTTLTPQYTRKGMVPENTQAEMSIPMARRIRMAGSTSASFCPVEAWTAFHPWPWRWATHPATAADTRSTATRSSPLVPRVSVPTAKSTSMVAMGRSASQRVRPFGVP
jgi:hypothetical protein